VQDDDPWRDPLPAPPPEPNPAPLPPPTPAGSADPHAAADPLHATPATAPASPAPHTALADGTVRRLDPAFVPYERLGGWVSIAFVLGLGPIAIGIFWLWSEASLPKVLVIVALWALLLVFLVVTNWIMPEKRYERFRWILSPAGLEIRHGVIFRTITSVPRARVQHTDVAQGPIQRRFGLASLVIHTAGQQDSEIHLGGITFDTARAIRDDLMAAGAGDGS
jgi:membrane protein YdbS with pleckstrin-like domain